MGNRPKTFERSWAILEYLRWNSDQDHPVSLADMKKSGFMQRYLQDKGTFNDTIFNMALAMNCDENGTVKPQDQWKIMYRAFCEKYGGEYDSEYLDESDEEDELDEKPGRLPIRGLHYQHTFSYEEVNALIEGVLFSRTLDTKTANQLVGKIEENLTTRFYKKGPKNICTVRETVLGNREHLRENLLLIQRAIDDRVQICFRFNGYDRNKKLIPVRAEKDTVSPYYIVANGGRYYLLACMEHTLNGQEERRMSIWRVDLMTELEIPGHDGQRKGERALEKSRVEDLPQVWDENFPFQHLNMSYDKPVPITLRIRSNGQGRPDYTFLYDWFGDTFRYERTEEPYYDIVRVICSPFAMVNWALQYSDRVEVMSPASVRDALTEKIRDLSKRYGIEGENENIRN